MERIRPWLWRAPDRLSPRRAWFHVGLAAAVLALALGGLTATGSDDLLGLLSAAVLGLAGVGNLALAVHSLLPAAKAGRVARASVMPLGALMLLAGLAWLALAFKATVVDGASARWVIGAALGGIAVHWQARWQRRRQNGSTR